MRTTRALAAAAFLGLGVLSGPAPASGNEKETYEYLELFANIFETVRSEYVEEVEDKELIQSAIRGMLASLDPHSAYLDPDFYGDLQTRTRGSFGGIGIEVTQEDGFVKVIAPIDDTPGARAGLQSGDFITHVDGETLQGLTLEESIDLLRGDIGSKVTLTIVRGSENPFDVDIVRDSIRIRAVHSRLEDDVGYVRITTFSNNVDNEIADAIDELREETGDQPLPGLILDLRNNPGGLLEQAVAVSDLFLERGEIVSTRGRNIASIQRFDASPGDVVEGLPVVVLVNSGSASASEIVAGALQEHDRAIIVGTKTFGKGSVQTLRPLRDKGGLRLTTSRYYTPSGNSIQGLGITPDVLIEFMPPSDEEVEEIDDTPAEADLRGSLEGDLNAEETERENEAAREQARQAAERRRLDNQLAYAIDLIHGITVYQR